MVSLQQIDYSYLRKDESINTSQEYIVAVHRRSMTYLTYTTDTKVVKTYQHNPINHREFNNIGVWVIPNDKLIISFFPIEVYDAFLVVFDSNSYSNNDENNNGDSYSDANSNGNSNSINDRNSKNKRRNSSVMILDFSCVYIQEVALPNVESILCAEFDQHKKDLIVGLASCSVLCYSLRMVKAFEARKTNDYDAKHFHLVLRTHGKVSELTVKQPIQIASFDLLGFCLVLLANGDMICLDESSLDALWSIQGELFLIKPNRIAVDKFGIDFIVYGRNETKTKEMLEYWTPPTDFVSCEIGRFSRTSIPVTDGVLSFTIESVGHDRANALLTILSSRLSLQLWKPLGDGIISNETSLPLALTDDALSRITSAHFKQNLVDKNFIGLPHQFGVFMFNADQTKPETPVIFTATFLASVTRVAIHLPSGSDVKREQTYMNISIARLASSNEEPSSNSEVFDIFPVSNALHSPQLNSPGRTEAIFDYSKSLRLQSGDARSEITGEDMVDLLNTNNENALPESPLAGEQLEDGSIASNQSYQAQSIISDVDKELLVRNMQSADDIVREPPDRSMFESLHENSSLLASYLNSEIFGNRRSNHPNGDANFSRPNSAAILEAPSTFYYEPYSKFFNNSLAEQNFFSVNKTMSMFQIVAPFSVLVYNKAVSDPADNSMSETEMFLCTRKGLINVFKYNGNIADLCEELSFTKLSFAFRTGKLFIFTDYKEGYLYDISSNLTHPEAPVRINLNMKKSCSTMIVVAADVALLHPQFKPKHPHQSKKGSFLTAEEVENIGTYTVYFLGDSDGNVHFTICHKASVVSNGILRAHSSAITKISTTGDAIRPLWRVGSSRSYDNSTQIVPNSVPGSAIVTTSKDGEVKVWQPIFTHPQGGRGRAAIDRVFLEFSLSWRMVGLFTTGVKTANDPYSRSVQSISLDPTCMTVLLGFQNGTIQQWCIPGLVDLDNGQLNTVHKPIWSSNLHTNSVTELNVWLHQSNTTIADVDVSKQNERRIEVIAELAAYIKGAPNRTVGYKLQHLRELSRNSSMTSSSGDRSIILWGFEVSKSVSDFVSFYLMPYPARRFFFSSSPRHGICSCYTSSTKPEHNMWKISALVNGIVVLVHQEARGLLFVADKLLSSKVAGMELIEISEPSVKKAVDFSMTDFFPNDDVAALGGMSAMPAIGQIHKASKFIDSYNHHIKNKKQRVSSTNILEEWTMVAKDLAPVVSTVHFDPNDHNDIRFLLPDEAESQGENIDHLVAVPRPASPFKITTKVANTLSGGKYIVDRHEDVDESTAPKRVSGIAMELGVDNSRVEQRSINMQGQVKVVHNGIAMVANDKLQLDTLKNPKKVNALFVRKILYTTFC